MSPIPLGILASSGGAANAFEHIQTVNLASNVSSLTLSSGGVWSQYKHLKIYTSFTNTTDSNLRLRVSYNDTSYTYYNLTYYSNLQKFWQSQTGYYETDNYVPGTNMPNNRFTGEITVSDINNTSKSKTSLYKWGYGGPTGYFGVPGQALFVKGDGQTQAITSVIFSINGGNLRAGSSVAIYGIKGA